MTSNHATIAPQNASDTEEAGLGDLEKRLINILETLRPLCFDADTRLLRQVPYSSFLETSAQGGIGCETADFAIVSSEQRVLCVFDYKGGARRDIVTRRNSAKTRACIAANIAYVEIPGDFSAVSLVSIIEWAKTEVDLAK